MKPLESTIKKMTDHSTLRARERSGIWLENDLFLIKKIIQNYMGDQANGKTRHSSQAILLYREKKSHGAVTDKYHFLIDWRGKFIWVVWNNFLQATNTFLPLDGLINKIQYLPNSVIGFLMSRNLIDINQLKKFDVVKVHYAPNRKHIINNDSLWDQNQPATSH